MNMKRKKFSRWLIPLLGMLSLFLFAFSPSPQLRSKRVERRLASLFGEPPTLYAFSFSPYAGKVAVYEVGGGYRSSSCCQNWRDR